MKYTANYLFKKPDASDTVNIKDINDSFDLVDSALKQQADNNNAMLVNETARIASETDRSSKETIRQTNETNRATAESERVTEFNAITSEYETALHENTDIEIVAARLGEANLKAKLQKVDASLADIPTQKTTKELGANSDNLTDDSTLLNAYLQIEPDRHLFLNQEKYSLNSELLINQPNTVLEGNAFARGWQAGRLRKSALFANHSGDIVRVDIPSSENGVNIKNISLHGNDLAQNGLVIGDYVFSGSSFENIHVMNVLDTAFILEGNNYSTYYEKLFCTEVNKALSLRKGNSHNVTFRGCHLYAKGLILDLFTDFDISANASKMIVFDSCDFSHVEPSELEQILIKTGKCNNVVFQNCYFEGAQVQLKEYLIELGTITGVSSMVKFYDCHFAGTNYNYFCKLTNAIYPEFKNCYFESLPNMAWFKASTDTTDTVNQNIQGMFLDMVFSNARPLIGTDVGKTAIAEEKAFWMICNKSGYGGVHQRGGFKVANNTLDNYIFRGYDKDLVAYPFAIFHVSKNSLYFGDGTVAPSKGFYYDAQGNINFNNGLKTGVNYLAALQVGNVWLWCNGNNQVMFKRISAPTSDADGLYLTSYAVTTATRPTTGKTQGSMFFDATLNKPIWWSGTAWVDATGTTV